MFDYTHRVARHVMTLRRDVVTLTAGVPFDDNLRIALANQYTRYPLVEPGTDRVVGYIHLKDIVSALASGKRPAFMRELVREPIYASEDTRLEWLRREFQRRRVHIAIILGPGHTFAGIVTLEDLLEEVVGEIQDEQDAEEIPPIVRNADGSFEIDGRLTLDVAARELGIDVPGGAPRGRDAGRLHHHPAPRGAGPRRRHRGGRLPLHRAGRPRPPHPPAARGAPALRRADLGGVTAA